MLCVSLLIDEGYNDSNKKKDLHMNDMFHCPFVITNTAFYYMFLKYVVHLHGNYNEQ